MRKTQLLLHFIHYFAAKVHGATVTNLGTATAIHSLFLAQMAVISQVSFMQFSGVLCAYAGPDMLSLGTVFAFISNRKRTPDLAREKPKQI